MLGECKYSSVDSVTVRHPALHRDRLAQPVFLPGARCWGAGGGRPWQFHPGLTPAVCHSGLPIAASEQAARGENCVGPQYNSQYNRKAQEAPEFSKRCLRRQTSRGTATWGSAKSRGQNPPSAAWGAAGACFYSYSNSTGPINYYKSLVAIRNHSFKLPHFIYEYKRFVYSLTNKAYNK